MLDLAVNYFLRNRSRLFEWWCVYGSGQGRFLSEEDNIVMDFESFDAAFAQKCEKIGIQTDIDADHYIGKYPAILKDGTSNEMLMSYVMEKAIRIELL